MKSPTRIVVIISMAVLAASVLLILDIHRASEDEVVHRFHSNQTVIVRQFNREIDQYLRARSQGIQVLSTLASLQHRDMKKMTADIQEYFQYVKKNYVKAISVYDEKGTIINSTTEDAIGRNYANSEFFQWATRSENKGKQFVSSLIRVAENQVELPPYFRFLIVTPIYQETLDPRYPKLTHKFVGVLTVTIDLEEVIAAFLPLVTTNMTKEQVWIIDTNGTVLFQSEHPEMVLKSIRRRDEACMRCHVSFDYVEKLLAEKQGTIEYELKERPKKLAYFAPLTFENAAWIIVVNVPLEEVSGFLERQLMRTFLLIGLITIAFVGASVLIYRGNRSKIRSQEEAKQWREKRELEDRVRESEEHYRAVVNNSADAIIIHCEGKIVFVNPAAVRMIGASSPNDLIGKSAIEFVHPDERGSISKRILEMSKSGKSSPWLEERFLRMGGDTIYVEAIGTPTTYNGKPSVQVIIHDITERKRAETALATSLSEQKSIMGTIPDIFFVLDLNGNVVKWNRSLEVVTGYAPQELLAKPTADFFDKEYQPIIAQAIRKAFEKGYNEVECPLRRKDGTIIPYLWNGAVLRDGKGSVIGLTGVGRDLTERKRAEEVLQATEKRFRVLIEKSSDVIALLGADGTIQYESPAATHMLGYAFEELKGRNAFELVHPDDLHPITELFAPFSQTPNATINSQFRFRHKDGSWRWLDVVGTNLLAEPSVQAIIVNYRDITERKQAEEALRTSEEKYRMLINQMSDGLLVVDNNDIIQFVNEKLCKIVGYMQEELIGKIGFRMLLPEENWNRLQEKNRQRMQGISEVYDLELKKKSGEKFWVSVSASPIYDPKGEVIGSTAVISDITERKLAEQASKRAQEVLRESEERFTAFMNNIPAVAWMKDPTTWTFSYINNAFEKVFDITREEISKRTDFDLWPEEVARQLRENDLNVMSSGKTIQTYEDVPLPGGALHHWLVLKFPLHAPSGKRFLGGTAVDVTERTQAEEALRASEAKYRSLFENVLEGIYQSTADGRLLTANPALVGMLGYGSEEELKKVDIAGNLYVNLAEREAWAQQLEKEGVIQNVELTLKRKDGKHITVLENAHVVRDEQGAVLHYEGTLTDITERKQAEEALKASEERQGLILRSLPVAIYTAPVDPGVDAIWISENLFELTGYSADEFVAETNFWRQRLHPEDRSRVLEAFERAAVLGEVNIEYRWQIKNGQYKWFLDRSVRHEVGTKQEYFGVLTDITERKRSEEAGRSLETQLQQAQKFESLGTLASGIAHDFNNILGIILGYSSLMERTGRDPQSLSQSAQAISTAVHRGANLVSQILTFARKTDVLVGPVDLNMMIKEIFKMLKETFPRKIELSLQLRKDIPFINADATQVHQVLLNLSVNARDAMSSSGTLTFKTKVVNGSHLRTIFPNTSDEDYVHLSVSDTGTGMNEKTRSRIFDPFFTTKEKGKGTGLGLSVVYGVMKNHNGFIDVQSELGKGATFNLYFPVPNKSKQATVKQTETRQEIPEGNEMLLVVEDEEAILALMKNILEVYGYRVLAVQDGIEALRVYQEHKDEIALVLTDIGLPKISGDQLFHQLKKLNPSVRVILASGFIEPNTKAEILKAGVRYFIQKPYNPDDVLRAIRRVLDT